ncbi:MAG: flavin reductase family protein [Hamadaea sp.]|uniref:flavin reductase family protein n=1 Tax=Hamadaea sp. TaxID=2024425 RepID=UPI0017D7B75E|nr:flavin reductase family protein [Hamadaea sp.]NUR69919.1 flavin reductase family protein [Hamadaea sp.]NUT22523.1 flavin reductase family protein [Hamadaea sp.]
MHQTTDLKVLYFGTPVVVISSRNPDGSTNLAPMSSAWWLGQECVLGLGDSSQTSANLRREGECVLNLVPSTLVAAIDRLALTTGRPDVPPHKADMGYRHVADKFGVAGLTPQESQLVRPQRVAECPIQLECTVTAAHPLSDLNATAFHAKVLRAYVEETVGIPGTAYVDPIAWDPLIMKFCDFFGGGENLAESRLAEAWQMPSPVGPARR